MKKCIFEIMVMNNETDINIKICRIYKNAIFTQRESMFYKENRNETKDENKDENEVGKQKRNL